MDHFDVISHCFKQGRLEFSAEVAAPIMGVTVKTAKNYLSGKTKPDCARLRLLRAVLGKKIIPQDAPIWYDEKTKSIWTDTGYQFDTAKLVNHGWFQMHTEKKIDQLTRKVETLQAELAEKVEAITALQAEAVSTSPRLPDNVILFPTPRKELHP